MSAMTQVDSSNEKTGYKVIFLGYYIPTTTLIGSVCLINHQFDGLGQWLHKHML